MAYTFQELVAAINAKDGGAFGSKFRAGKGDFEVEKAYPHIAGVVPTPVDIKPEPRNVPSVVGDPVDDPDFQDFLMGFTAIVESDFHLMIDKADAKKHTLHLKLMNASDVEGAQALHELVAGQHFHCDADESDYVGCLVEHEGGQCLDVEMIVSGVHAVKVRKWTPTKGNVNAAIVDIKKGDHVIPFLKYIGNTESVGQQAPKKRIRLELKFVLVIPSEYTKQVGEDEFFDGLMGVDEVVSKKKRGADEPAGGKAKKVRDIVLDAEEKARLAAAKKVAKKE